MEKIPTAENFQEEYWKKAFNNGKNDIDKDWYVKCLIDFTKLHVEAALKKASEKAEVIMVDNCHDHTPFRGACVTCSRYDNPKVPTTSVNKQSILKSYPLTNIR